MAFPKPGMVRKETFGCVGIAASFARDDKGRIQDESSINVIRGREWNWIYAQMDR
jgi:hypothetical protein